MKRVEIYLSGICNDIKEEVQNLLGRVLLKLDTQYIEVFYNRRGGYIGFHSGEKLCKEPFNLLFIYMTQSENEGKTHVLIESEVPSNVEVINYQAYLRGRVCRYLLDRGFKLDRIVVVKEETLYCRQG